MRKSHYINFDRSLKYQKMATNSTTMDINFILSTANPVFMVYVTWTGALMIKMVLMSFLTSIHRFSTKVSTLILRYQSEIL